MFRRTVSAVLLASYLAGQAAALPHAHPDSPHGHDSRPHMHSGWLLSWLDWRRAEPPAAHAHGHAHGHSHQHSHTHGHSHSHATSPQQSAGGAEESLPAQQPAPGGEHPHDADCVYLSPAVAGAVPFQPWSGPDNPIVSLLDANAIAWQALPQAGIRQAHGPPQKLAQGCPLYLTLRTLRI